MAQPKLMAAAQAVPSVPVAEDSSTHGASLHGENAARRQAITELLFFASVGDLNRCKKICKTWRIQVGNKTALGGLCGSYCQNCLIVLLFLAATRVNML